MAVSAAIGLAVFLGLMWFVANAHAHWWRRVAEHYRRGRMPSVLARKVPETIIVTGLGNSGGNFGYRVYGTSGIAIGEGGLILTQIPPFNFKCPPLFLPFAEMDLRETDWGLSLAYALRMGGLPDIDVIVFPRVVSWIREHVTSAPFGLVPDEI
jgi:hypothetical protein